MKNQLSQIEEIELFVTAKYSILYIVSWEEFRIENALIKLAKKLNKKLFIWSVNSGLYSPPEPPQRAATDPLELINIISGTEPSSIFILKDLNPWFKDARLIRGIRDLLATLKNTYKTLIILSPELEIPVNLEKDITVIDYKLPDVEELGKLFEKTYEQVSMDKKIQLSVDKNSKYHFAKACTGLTLTEAENAFSRAIAIDSAFTDADLNIILEEKKHIIRRSRFLEYYEATAEMIDIGGLNLLKEWLKKRSNAFSEKAEEYGLPQPKGILLFGVQGCCKSLICKAIARLWNMPLLRLDMGAIFGMWIGLSEENMRKAIKTVESVSPCILWVDEFEKGFAGIGSSGITDSGTTARVIGTFLTWMQEKTSPVFIAATSNDIFKLPPEILRKGRFDELFFVDLPSKDEQREIFKIHIKKRKRNPEKFDLEKLLIDTTGFSGAEIEQCIIDGLYLAFSENRELESGDILKAIKDTVPLSKIMEHSVEELRKWAKARTRFASEFTEKAQTIGFHNKI